MILVLQGLFLSVLPKTQYPKNAKTQFENPKTQFGNCKTLKNWQFYASHPNKFHSLKSNLVQPAEIPFKTKFPYLSDLRNQFKNAESQFEHAKIPSENPNAQFDTKKPQFENSKTKKTR